MDLKKLIASFGHAGRGVVEMFIHQQNARIHLLATIAVLVFGIVFQLSLLEWAMCILCIAIVLALEAMNSAIERLVDHLTSERVEWARQVKDYSAGSVLLGAIGAACVGVIIFAPKLMHAASALFSRS